MGIFTSHGTLNEHVMAVFSKMENPWQKELQKIPTKPPVQEPLVSSKPPSGVILGPYSTNNIASSNKKSTSPPPIPAYLTMPPREKIVHRGQEKSHMAAVKQIFINCITLRNLRVIMRHISPGARSSSVSYLAPFFFCSPFTLPPPLLLQLFKPVQN